MSIENKLDYWIDRLKIQWKGMGKLKYLPLFVIYIIIPFSVWLYSRIDHEYYFDYLEEQLVFFVPLLSVWWALLLLQQYVEGEGRELLWIEKGNRLVDIIIYLFLYMLTLIPMILYIMNNMTRGLIVIPVLLLQSFMFSGCFYMLSMVCASISVGFVVVFIYALFSGNRIMSLATKIGFDGLQSTLFYLIAGIFCFIIGEMYHAFREKNG